MENSIEDIIKKSAYAKAPADRPTPGLPPIASAKGGALKLRPEQISSEVFVIAPTQVNYIAELFANSVADAMNMRAFAPKIRVLAEKSLRAALAAAKKQGA
ncbi:MAG: hypothetical protein FWF97_02210 [Alphaproteobacteria bacterium]|nr:hypothetical protein [Alphaproteobacteria bacterium]